ncbi:MAG: hypothetical protein WEC80_02825 [Patescibacteria group bacterium]
MNITTENIIKLLAKNEDSARNLLEKFNNLSPDERFVVENNIWNLYDFMYQQKLDINMQKTLNDTGKGSKELSKNFYKQIEEETQKEIEREFYSNTQSADLAGVRDKISKIIGN